MPSSIRAPSNDARDGNPSRASGGERRFFTPGRVTSAFEKPHLPRAPLDVIRMSYTVTPAVREQRRQARLRHGAQSRAALSPLIVSMKKSLLARMGLRQRDLNWAGRELLDVRFVLRARLSQKWRRRESNPRCIPAASPSAS